MLNSVADWQGRTLTEARLSKLGDVTSSHGIVAVWSASIRGLVDAEEKKLAPRALGAEASAEAAGLALMQRARSAKLQLI